MRRTPLLTSLFLLQVVYFGWVFRYHPTFSEYMTWYGRELAGGVFVNLFLLYWTKRVT